MGHDTDRDGLGVVKARVGFVDLTLVGGVLVPGYSCAKAKRTEKAWEGGRGTVID